MKKIFTSLMMLFAVLTVSAQANVFTSNVEFAAGEQTYLNCIININGEEYPCVKIGTSKVGGSCIAKLPAGTTEFSFHAIGWSKSDNTDFTVVGAGIDDTQIAGTGNISGNSPYTFDVDNYDPEAPFFTYAFEAPLAEETEVTLAADYRVVFYGANVVTAPAAGWDGTVTTSLDSQVLTSIDGVEGMTMTFNGANSIEVDEYGYLCLADNEDGWPIHKVWMPGLSTYTLEGSTITLNGWVDYADVAAAKPMKAKAVIKKAAADDCWYIQDYGTFIIDGEEGIYLDDIAVAHIEATAEPFMLTSVSNNGIEGNIVGVEASEQGVSYMFTVTATGKALNAGEVLPTLSIMEKDVDFGQASVIAYGGEEAYVRFMAPEKYYFTEAGTYVLSIPEGTFVDAEGTPNAAVAVKWVVLEGNNPTTINIEGAEVGTVTNEWGDVKYTATVKFQKPAGAVYAWTEGMQVSLNGETSNVQFMAPSNGFVELGEEDEVTLVYTDGMMAATTDPDFEGELRQPGTYVATAEIYFMDADYLELTTVAKYTGSIVLPALTEEPVSATITAIGTDAVVAIEEYAHIADAYSFEIDFNGKEYQTVTCVVNKLTWNEPDPFWGETEGYYSEEELAINGVENNGDGTWTATFSKQPQNFENGVLYEVKVRAWEGDMFDENWNILPYDQTLIRFNGCGEADPEPIVIVMGEPVYTTFSTPIDPKDFNGISVSYPDNNIAEAYAGTEALEYGAIALICESAAIYECNADGLIETWEPVAEEYFASNFDMEGVDLFTRNVTLEAGKHYVAIIDGMTVQNQMDYDDPYLWVQGPWDMIQVYFETAVADGIQNVAAESNDVKFNIAGQRVNNNAKGIIIKNGKKVLVK